MNDSKAKHWHELKEAIRQQALHLGFARCGIAPVSKLPHEKALHSWLDDGFAGSMTYMTRHRDLRACPQALLPEAKSALVCLARYGDPKEQIRPVRSATSPRHDLSAPKSPNQDRKTPQDSSRSDGKIARYARGADYHILLHRRLEKMLSWIKIRLKSLHDDPGYSTTDLHARIVVDTAPLLERELAVAAGLGFIGKNTLLITPGLGSFTVIGTLLLSLPLPPDQPLLPRCGSCDLCLRGCPTQAFSAPYRLDARRCISYLTIESPREKSPEERSRAGEWIAGCDVCQEVCPYNWAPAQADKSPPDPDLSPRAPISTLDLAETISLRSGAHRRLVKKSALARISRPHLIRNAAYAATTTGIHNERIDQALRKAISYADPLTKETLESAEKTRALKRQS